MPRIRLMNRAKGKSLKPVFLGMDSNVEFACPSEPAIGEYSLGLVTNERFMQLVEWVTCCCGEVDHRFLASREFLRRKEKTPRKTL